MNIQFTLLSEGSSDQALLPILSFVLRERGAETVESQWADIGRLREPPQALPDQIRTAIDLYPYCSFTAMPIGSGMTSAGKRSSADSTQRKSTWRRSVSCR